MVEPVEIPIREALNPDIAETVNKIVRLFEQLPLAYKRYALHQDIMMVLHGLKAATDYSFLGDTFRQDEFDQFKSALVSVGVRVSNPQIDERRRFGLLYRPDILRRETISSNLAPPYDGQQDIDEYYNQAVKNGYNDKAVAGKIFSFPESAIRDFIQSQKKSVKLETVYFGDETYSYSNPPQPDVVEREKVKREFFSVVDENSQFKVIKESNEARRSDQEWRQRLPQWTKRK